MATEADRQLAEPMHQQRQRRDSQRGSRRHRQRRRHPQPKTPITLLNSRTMIAPSRTHTHRQDDRGASPPVVASLQLLRGREMLMPAAAVFVMNMMRSKSGKRWPAQQQTQLFNARQHSSSPNAPTSK